MSNWDHETKIRAVISENTETISELTFHTTDFYKNNVPSRNFGTLRRDVHGQHNELQTLHHPADMVEYAKTLRTVRPYTKNSKKLNDSLINKPKSITHKVLHAKNASNLSKLIEKHGKPLENETHVYSGTGKFNPGEHMKEGVIHLPAFTSTSINPTTALEFTSSGNEHHIIHFHLPKGYSKGFYIGQLSSVNNEHEMLLDKGQKWKLENHEEIHTRMNGGSHKVHVWSVKPHVENIHEMTYHDKDEVKDNILGSIRSSYIRMNSHPDIVKQHDTLTTHTHATPFVSQHIGAIKDYTDSSFLLNRKLIANGELNDHQIKMHANLQSMFSKHSGLPEDVHAYSGTSYNPEKAFDHSKVIHTPAYTSASLHPGIAHGFSGGGGSPASGEEEHIIHFHLPKGHKDAVYIAPHSHAPDEREILINHNQKWRLTDHQTFTRHNPYDENKLRTVHIWSVKPHNENVNEALTHTHHYFTKAPHRTYVKKYGFSSTNGYTQATKKALSIRHTINDKLKKEMDAQGESLKGGTEPKNHVLESAEYYSKSNGSRHINGHLIEKHSNQKIDGYDSNGPEKADWHIKNLKEYIGGSKPLETEGHFYSGTGTWKPDVKEGDVLHTPAFTSTSINPDTANYGFSDSHIIHFHLPKGYKNGRYIAEHTMNSAAEQEYLLNSDQKWKVQKVTKAINKAHKTHKTIISVIPHEDGTPK